MQAHLYGQAQGDDVGHPGQAHSVTTWGTLHALVAYLNPRQDTFITEKAAGPQAAQPSANGCGNQVYLVGLTAKWPPLTAQQAMVFDMQHTMPAEPKCCGNQTTLAVELRGGFAA